MAAKIATKTVDLENQTISVEFTDGEVVSLSLKELQPEMVIRLALHGGSQKGGDSYSGETELSVAKEKLKTTFQRLRDNDWRATAAGGASRISDLATALSRLLSKSIEEVVEMLEEKTKEEKAALRKHPQVALMLNKIKEEKLLKAAEESATPISL